MNSPSWTSFQKRFYHNRALGFSLDYSKVSSWQEDGGLVAELKRAISEMTELEKGAIANPDEQRMVGHYWLRDPARSPNAEIAAQIKGTVISIEAFALAVHQGAIHPEKGGRFESILLIGIGGSALGPQFVTQALGGPTDALSLYFFDNTDPDGMNRVLSSIPALERTLTIIISKSGGTKETRNGMLIAKAAYEAHGLSFAKHAVAVTGEDSELDRYAIKSKWIQRFPMWDWVGGRTSEFSAVGLLPAALQGYPIQKMLDGAAAMDQATREADWLNNPAAILAAAWYQIGSGRGAKDMVLLPYKDRLELFSRYLQQLVMESLGKRLDRAGATVHQGLSVFGNKGSTDQHAYVQQLRDGLNNFFVIFLEVLQESTSMSKSPAKFEAHSVEVEPGVFASDYLSGFLQGTQTALHESDRQSITLTIDKLSAFEIGMLVALFERSVGLYASLINVNAYHQPGVEAGKKAAAQVLDVQREVVASLRKTKKPVTVSELALQLGSTVSEERLFRVLRHLGANQRIVVLAGDSIFNDRYCPLE